MAFPTGWSHRVPITIESDDIDAGLTDWTLVFDQSFDSVLTQVDGPLDADGTRASINGGGDIRFSSDEAGTTQLACDIRGWVTDNTPANATCEVAVCVPSVSSSVDTIIYMWWGATGETQPAVDSTYGQYNAYDSGFLFVYDMGQDPTGGTDAIKDRTSNQHHGTASGMASDDLVTGKVGNALEFDGNDEYIHGADDDIIQGTDLTVQALINVGQIGSDERAFWGLDNNSSHSVYRVDKDGSLHFWTLDYQTSAKQSAADVIIIDTWYLASVTYDYSGSDGQLYLDGSTLPHSQQDDVLVAIGDRNSDIEIGGRFSGTWDDYDGLIDEYRVSNVIRSAAWIAADYANLFNTSGFLTWGSITDIGGTVDELTATGITCAVANSSVTLTQVHKLTATGITCAVTNSTSTLTQVHKLTATGITCGVANKTVTLSEIDELTATGITCAVTNSSVTLTEHVVHELTATGITCAVTNATVTLSEIDELIATGITCAVTNATVTLTEYGIHSLVATGITCPVANVSATLTQVHKLTATGITCPVANVSVTLSEIDELVATGITCPVTNAAVTLTEYGGIVALEEIAQSLGIAFDATVVIPISITTYEASAFSYGKAITEQVLMDGKMWAYPLIVGSLGIAISETAEALWQRKVMCMRGMLITDANSGNIQLRWAKRAAGSSVTVLHKGSWIKIRKLSGE